ncbi:ATP-binding protein [Streptomyces sp. NBC_01186]|uniref:GTP-binding protein n=1 Tax=Streptomyces sp. NBC_01186 TaxID=2903765 RepID=UPI002E0DEECC|nr:ATP-binding protein [Streptomyces sp. NBC_01186]
MASGHSDGAGTRFEEGRTALKVLVAGAPGAGKTSFIRALSSPHALRAEAPGGRTVVLEFGGVALAGGPALYLFAACAHERFWYLWDELAAGALGAVVLADIRSLERCFPAVDYFEHRSIPFVVLVNCCATDRSHSAQEVLAALDLRGGTPVVLCDARDRDAAKEVLVRLLEHAVRRRSGSPFFDVSVTGATGV